MKLLSLIINNCLIIAPYLCLGQSDCPPTSYPGRVSLNTSSGRGLDAVKIQINNLNSVWTHNGNFEYKLTDCPGSRLRIEATKLGYGIVNHMELSHVLERGLSRGYLQFHIIMCVEKDLESRRTEYYDKVTELNFIRRLATLEGRIKELRRQKNASRDSLNILDNKRQELINNKENDKSKEVAKLLTNINESILDTTYQKAYSLYQEGQLTDDELIIAIIKQEERANYSHDIKAKSLLSEVDPQINIVRASIQRELGGNWGPAPFIRIPLQTIPRKGDEKEGFVLIEHKFRPSLSTGIHYKAFIKDKIFTVQLSDESKTDTFIKQSMDSQIDWEKFRLRVKRYWLLMIQDRQKKDH